MCQYLPRATVLLYVSAYLRVTIKSLWEKAVAPHSSTLARKIQGTEEPGRLQSRGSLGVGHDWETSLSLSCIGEGNGNPLQYSCLENPRHGGAWWAAVYGVAQSRTLLKRLSSSMKSLYGMSFSVKSRLHKIFYPAEYNMGILYNSSSTNIIQNLDISWSVSYLH